MKKYIFILFTLSLLGGLTACGGLLGLPLVPIL